MKDDMTNKSLRGIIVILVLFSIWVVISNTKKAHQLQKEHSLKLEEMNRKVDSLGSEIFILNTNVMRYEIALENLEEENPSAASEFNKQLSQTE